MKKIIGSMLIVVLLLSAGIGVMAVKSSTGKLLSKQQIGKYVQKYVAGDVLTIQLNDELYHVEVKGRDKIIYDLQLHANTGELISKVAKNATSMHSKIDLTLNDAKVIALKKIKGTIHNVRLDRENQTYEIEMVRGKYDYTFIIAITTGKIKSRTKNKIEYLATPLTAKEVKELALTKQQGTLKKSRLDSQEGIYYVTIQKKRTVYTLQIDPYEKVILALTSYQKKKITENDNKKSKAVQKTTATKIALNNLPGKIVDSSLKNGVYHFSINTSKGTQHIRVDASTGTVLDQSSVTKPNNENLIDETRARTLALEKQSGDIQSMVYNGNEKRYDIVMLFNDMKITMFVDAISGVVTISSASNTEQLEEPNDKDMTPLPEEPSTELVQKPEPIVKKLLSEQSVSSIALARVGGTVTKMILSNAIYEVEVRDGTYEYALTIDAYTGVILNFTKEYEQ
ncbi:PepSY domain-containing protein [Kurthia sibirica]|uniref:PepSY domain-containing protein n=1 Tax=Kurthia sibirica TaxID=202750 RepID=A0A2U3APV4_9BACL|nr:PepSY domain-containing protein [Kurthia sibirica]PWI26578.1 hypothetical protein DEX24_02095 [Kurthia sibirica]GEK32828.1 hypothetical protein KSI01_03610 [Kurthia sibirica]